MHNSAADGESRNGPSAVFADAVQQFGMRQQAAADVEFMRQMNPFPGGGVVAFPIQRIDIISDFLSRSFFDFFIVDATGPGKSCKTFSFIR